MWGVPSEKTLATFKVVTLAHEGSDPSCSALVDATYSALVLDGQPVASPLPVGLQTFTLGAKSGPDNTVAASLTEMLHPWRHATDSNDSITSLLLSGPPGDNLMLICFR